MRAHTITTTRLAPLLSLLALGAAVIAAGASANFRSVDDPRGDVKCFHRDTLSRRPCSDSRKRNADVVRATAENEGGRLKHTIRVVGKVNQVRLTINTDSDSECEWKLFATRGGGTLQGDFHDCGGPMRTSTGRVRSDFHLHSVEIFFSKRSIGNPRPYRWSASAVAGPPTTQAVDFVPNGGGYIRH
jgi:hypothetical protein